VPYLSTLEMNVILLESPAHFIVPTGQALLLALPFLCLLFMDALCNKADHIYFHPVVCSFFLFLFPRLISAVGD